MLKFFQVFAPAAAGLLILSACAEEAVGPSPITNPSVNSSVSPNASGVGPLVNPTGSQPGVNPPPPGSPGVVSPPPPGSQPVDPGPPPPPPQCMAPTPNQCPDGTCVNTMTDSNNCGTCMNVCPSPQQCSLGTCRCPVTTDRLCNGACVPDSAFDSDVNNCGGCGVICETGQVCDLGACSSAGCAEGRSECNGGCVDTMSDAAHCGGCGMACTTGQSCVGGGCMDAPGCGAGQEDCNGTCVAVGTCDNGSGGNGPGPDGTAGEGPGPSTDPPPPGYYSIDEWHGCSWTSIGSVEGTVIMPQDFTQHEVGTPYCISGTVTPDPDYEGVALLGFNIAQPPEGADCGPIPVGSEPELFPAVTPTETGLAINFSKSIGSVLRVQIQTPEGAFDENTNDRWCYEIEDVQGPTFAPYAEFNTTCWDGLGTTYVQDGSPPISAVVFTVPGSNEEATPYDFCVSGFVDGNGPEDAPESLGGGGPLSGTLSEDFARAKIAVDGENYIVQNNNWGPAAGTQIINYTDNSFIVSTQTGGPGGGGEPASFPSIYIGSNGDSTGSPNNNTSSTDNLPIQISNISSIPTSMSHNASGGDYNVTYDVWFQSSSPAQGYDLANAGYLMVWYYKPGNRSPIGGSPSRTATIEGRTWDVWQGDRGDGTGATVVSYVIQGGGPLASFSFDLKAFIDDAVANHGFQTGWWLSDIFGGFEIWSGGQGISITNFTAVVNP